MGKLDKVEGMSVFTGAGHLMLSILFYLYYVLALDF